MVQLALKPVITNRYFAQKIADLVVFVRKAMFVNQTQPEVPVSNRKIVIKPKGCPNVVRIKTIPHVVQRVLRHAVISPFHSPKPIKPCAAICKIGCVCKQGFFLSDRNKCDSNRKNAAPGRMNTTQLVVLLAQKRAILRLVSALDNVFEVAFAKLLIMFAKTIVRIVLVFHALNVFRSKLIVMV